MTKVYGTPILVSEGTVRDLRQSYRLREVDYLVVKGKSRPVAAHEVIDPAPGEDLATLDRFLEAFGAALGLYWNREFARARDGFGAALELRPADTLSRLYASRAAHFLEHPPGDDWAGVWVLKEK